MQVDCFPDALDEWKRRPVGELAKVNSKYRLDKRKAYPFVEMSDVAEQFGGIIAYSSRLPESSGYAQFQENDILFGKITPCAENGKVALVKGLQSDFGIGSTEFIVLSPTSENDPQFIYALLSSHPVHGRAITRMEGSTGRLRITEDMFTKWLLVPQPSRDEQERIAQILDAVDTAIARTRDALAKAEHLKQGVLNELLKRGIGPDGRIRVDDKAAFQCTSLGYLPIAWGVSKVRDEFTLSTGFTLGEHRRPKINRRRYLRVANVQRSSITLDDVKELEAKDEEMADRTLTKNDLLVVEGHANPKEIGRCALVPDEAAGLTFQNHLFRLRPKKLTPEFAEVWLNSPWVQGYWQRTCASTSGLHTINQRTLHALPVVVPPLDEQRAIVNTIEALSANICCIEAKTSHLMKLKRGLMQDLLTGRVRVTHNAKNSKLITD